jgi:hypothetical protein
MLPRLASFFPSDDVVDGTSAGVDDGPEDSDLAEAIACTANVAAPPSVPLAGLLLVCLE